MARDADRHTAGRMPGRRHRPVAGVVAARPRPTLRGAMWLAVMLSLPLAGSLWALELAIRALW